MSRTLRHLGIPATVVAALALSLVAPAPAGAVTWSPLPTQTIKTKTTAVIRPVAPVPAGAKVTKSVVTVKRGTKTLATNVAKLSVPRGTYKAYSTVVYLPRLTHLVPIPLANLGCRYTDITANPADVAALTHEFIGPVEHIFGPVSYVYTMTCSGTDAHGTDWAWSKKSLPDPRTFDYWSDDRAGSCMTVLLCAAHQGNDPAAYFAPPTTTTGLYHRVAYYGKAVTRYTVRTVKVVRP